jgi:hypothetical protein
MDWRQVDSSRSRQPNESYADCQRCRTARIATSRQVPPDAIEQLLHTPEAFETWLRDQPPEAIVGDYVTPDDSPLANFIWDRLGVYAWTFDSIFDGKQFHAVSEWYAAFTRQEAAYIEQGWRDEGRQELAAADVLNILQSAVSRE